MNFDLSLYLVTDSTYHSEASFLQTVSDACESGITLLQLREKEKGGRAYLELAVKVKEIVDHYHIPLIIDDRVDIVLATDAAGVHVGSGDIPVATARRLLGKNKIVGATAKTVEAAIQAYQDGADYLGVGAIYPTTTKVKTQLTEVAMLNAICKAVPIPVVAIGGLNFSNMDVLSNSLMDGIAVVSAIMKSTQVKEDTAALKEKVMAMKRSYSAN